MENMENMENDNLENFKIEDDVLEDVSGGELRELDRDFCYYCRKRHTLMRQYPCKIKPYGSHKYYNDAYRYDCEFHGPFYALRNVNGHIFYFDAQLKRLN